MSAVLGSHHGLNRLWDLEEGGAHSLACDILCGSPVLPLWGEELN